MFLSIFLVLVLIRHAFCRISETFFFNFFEIFLKFFNSFTPMMSSFVIVDSTYIKRDI